MATLISPGVSVSVTDESFYTPAATGTTPMLFVVTAEDKTNPSGTTAAGTTKANAGKVWLITGQRDLTDTFGTPLFYTDASGTPLHGNELNEYGLQAAYSALGVSSRSYVVRADLNLSDLAPVSSPPEGIPVSGTYWLDTASTSFGIKEWNASTQKFTVKTPIVLDDSTDDSLLNGPAPSSAVGQQGDYCIVSKLPSGGYIRGNNLYYKTTSNTWVPVSDGFDSGKKVKISPHYDYPVYNASTATGSVWITSTSPSNGANWVVKYYNGATESWTSVAAPIYSDQASALYELDSTGGGKNIVVGSVFVDSNYDSSASETANFQLWRRASSSPTLAISSPVSTTATFGGTYSFDISETVSGSSSFSSPVTITLSVPNTNTILGSLVPASLSAAGLLKTTASFNTTTGVLTISHSEGGAIKISNLNYDEKTKLGFTQWAIGSTGESGTANFYQLQSSNTTTFLITNFKPLVYESHSISPTTDPADGTLWYSNVVDQVDIMVNSGTAWVGYRNQYPNTDPNGPLIQATEPTTQSDGTSLVANDIWIDTSDLEMYGTNVYVYDPTVSSTSKWVLQDTSDQSSPTGWVFADARWSTSGAVNNTPGILSDMAISNYVDPDAPNPSLYPRGIKLWNTRRSGFNVKKYILGHIDITANSGLNTRFNNQSMASYTTSRWVAQYPIASDGHGIFGRKAQRQIIVKALKSLVDSNVAVRDTDTLSFNLLASPGYPELIPNMVTLNTDRGLSAFVIGDTPFRLAPIASELSAYGLNSGNAVETGEDGAVTYNEYMGMFYPSGYTSDNTGNKIVVPASHMMLRTMINSDAKSYLWFAPAGTRRGNVDNVTSIGYITSEGEFKTTTVPQNLRDVLYDVKINPISNLTGVGLVNFGQKTRSNTSSALDRINVARLVAYLRRQLDILSRPFLFEPNDAQTRREIKAAADSLLLELVGQRALYDYIVVCDETNNTAARIDRNELYMDIAVEPVKAVEFIYIPLRIKNKGDIKAGL